MESHKTPWLAVFAIVLGVSMIVLIALLVSSGWEGIKDPGRAVIDGINKIIRGRPPWLG